MLIDLHALCNKYSFVPEGVIHIGAHLGEESDKYQSLNIDNVVWVEANPELCFQLLTKFQNLKNNIVINALISDTDGEKVKFYITNNGESSSMLELDKHKHHHPHIHVTKEIILTTNRVETIVENFSLKMDKYDFLNLDVQGAELMVLKGFGELIRNLSFIYTEVNTASIYKNCAMISELDEYLLPFGFKRMETHMTEYEWGDAFYVKIR